MSSLPTLNLHNKGCALIISPLYRWGDCGSELPMGAKIPSGPTLHSLSLPDATKHDSAVRLELRLGAPGRRLPPPRPSSRGAPLPRSGRLPGFQRRSCGRSHWSLTSAACGALGTSSPRAGLPGAGAGGRRGGA